MESHSLSTATNTEPTATTTTTNNKVSLFINPVTHLLYSNSDFGLISATGNILFGGVVGAAFASTKQYHILTSDGDPHTDSLVINEAMNWHSLLVNFRFD